MSKRKIAQISKNHSDTAESTSEDEASQNCFIPNSNDTSSDERDSVENESSDDNETPLPNVSYRSVFRKYTHKQKKLEENHVYSWVEKEKIYSKNLENEILLSNKKKKSICQKTPVELFELFFSKELKKHIINASSENGLEVSKEQFNTFIGILLLTTYNIRTSTYDYWSTDALLKCDVVVSAMSRNQFHSIKSKIKYSKTCDQNNFDKAWKVRDIINIFRKNIQQFGFFSTALSLDEMMVRFFGRTTLKQYLPSKPDKFGLKFWGLCDVNGYLFDLDVYCGKEGNRNNENLSSCALGSKVVLQMVNKLLMNFSKEELSKYHLYMDNFFTSSDLLVHLKKNGLKATGTVRRNRVPIKHEFEKKAVRGSTRVHHDKNSGINFISVIDSKQVSLLSTAASVNPTKPIKRYSSHAHSKVEYQFPSAFIAYNKFMGGVDLHDYRCKRVSPKINSKKWTWSVFLRIIQSSIVNATVIYNICKENDKISTKDMAIKVSESYLLPKSCDLKTHKSESRKRQTCSFEKCRLRTTRYCLDCKDYFYINCFSMVHK